MSRLLPSTTNQHPTSPSFDSVVILDYGSQYAQLIARRVRDAHVYCELVPYDTDWSALTHLSPKGIILSGGPASVYEPDAPQLPSWVLESGLPVLGICYGMQLLAQTLGGRVAPAQRREYGPAVVERVADHPIFAGLPARFDVWMSHGDRIDALPPGFEVLARSANAPYAAMARDHLIGLQFHPEVAHTPLGSVILRNFLFDVCGCAPTWTAESFVEQAIREIRERVGKDRVLLALSGGVDSSVAAALIHRAIGDQLTPVFVDTGLLREGEAETI